MYPLEDKKSTHLLTWQSQREGYQVKYQLPHGQADDDKKGHLVLCCSVVHVKRKTHTIQTESEKLHMNYQKITEQHNHPFQIPIITAAKYYYCYRRASTIPTKFEKQNSGG